LLFERVSEWPALRTTLRRNSYWAKTTPTVTLDLMPVPFLRLVGGAASAPRLIFTGALRVGCDLLLAAHLPRLLNIPRRGGAG